MTVSANDLFLITAEGNCFGQKVILTHGYRVEGVNPGLSESIVTQAMLLKLQAGGGGGDQFQTEYLACLPPDYNLQRWTAQKFYPIRFRRYFATINVAGTHAGSTETANLAGTITFATVLAGRSQIATKHIGPLAFDATTMGDGSLTLAMQTLLNNLAIKMEAALLDPSIGLIAKPIIIHRQLDADGHVVGYSSTDIWTHQVGDTVNVLGRRTVRRGE